MNRTDIDSSQVNSSLGTSAELSLEVTYGGSRFVASGNGDFVLRAFQQFREDILLLTRSVTIDNHISISEEETGNSSERDSDDVNTDPVKDDVPLPVFLEQRTHITTNPERAVAILVWAEKAEGIQEFTFSQIKELWDMSGYKIPGNLARDLASAMKKGWINRKGNIYTVTTYGRNFVLKPKRPN